MTKRTDKTDTHLQPIFVAPARNSRTIFHRGGRQKCSECTSERSMEGLTPYACSFSNSLTYPLVYIGLLSTISIQYLNTHVKDQNEH